MYYTGLFINIYAIVIERRNTLEYNSNATKEIIRTGM